jgi:hypothetical protein
MTNYDEFYDEDEFEEIDPAAEEEYDDGLDELSREFVDQLIDKIMVFMKALVGHDLRPYQKPLARRIIESVVINEGEEITASLLVSQVSQKLLRIQSRL